MRRSSLELALLPVWTLALVVAGGACSPVPVKIHRNGLTLTNLCQQRFLGLLLPDVDPEVKFEAWEASSGVTAICPYLKYTCCSEDNLRFLAAPLKKLNSFLRFREAHLAALLRVVEQIGGGGLETFLEGFGAEDQKCFNRLQKQRLDARLKKFAEDTKALKEIKEEAKHLFWDRAYLLKSFEAFAGRLPEVQAGLRAEVEERERFYSSLLCAACSPEFIRQINFHRDEQLLRVKRDVCTSLLQAETRRVAVQRALYFVQRLLDVSFCARTNSRPELNFDSGTPGEVSLLDFDPEKLAERTKKLKHCIEAPDPYKNIFDHKSLDYCTRACRDNLHIFALRLRNVQSALLAENELNHTFLRNSGAEGPQARLRRRRGEYLARRKQFEDSGHVRVGEDQAETFQMVLSRSEEEIDSSHFHLEVQLFAGLDLSFIQMEPVYFESAPLRSAWLLLVLIWTWK